MTKKSLLVCMSLLWLAACGNESNLSAPDQAVTNGGTNAAKPRSAESAKRFYDGPDIAGIHIGMTPGEAEAKLKAYDENIVLQRSSRTFKYQALGSRYETEPSLAAMVGSLPGGSGSIQVGFSWPPNLKLPGSEPLLVEPLWRIGRCTAFFVIGQNHPRG